jgi:hypothetical protein
MRGLAVTDKPTDLGVNDTNFLFYAADYAHTWRWTGSTWQYAPGDRASGEIAWFTADPGAGWALCNGTSTFRTLGNATTSAISTPNLITAYVKGAAAYSPTVVPATGGTISGTTDTESGHTHAVDLPYQNTLGSNLSDIEVVYSASSPDKAARAGHVHSIDPPTVTSAAGSAHSHGLTGASIAAGEPKHVDLMPYLRQ